LDSIPKRIDIEVIVVDDGSTDGTFEMLKEWRDKNPLPHLQGFRTDENHGVGHARNIALDHAQGEYIYGLDADDRLLQEWESVVDRLDGTDIVYVRSVSNSGSIWRVTEATKLDYSAMGLRFIRREFLGNTRCEEIRFGEDKSLNRKLLEKPHTERYEDSAVYHYNHPRIGSLCWKQNHGDAKMMFKNVFYFSYINAIGGVETMFWNLARKYGKTHDITILYDSGDPQQIERLRKYVRVVRNRGQHISCEKLFCNFNTSIMDNVEANEYCVILHSDYQAREINVPKHRKIDRYIAVSELVKETAEKKDGIEAEVCYNPIIVDKPKKVLHLISATRLTAEKGKERMKRLADILDGEGIPFVWTVYTNDLVKIDNPHIAYMPPSLSIYDYIADADYLVQLSDTEGYSYTILEALSLGTPVITTPCPVYKEMGITKENGFIIPFDFTEKDVPIKAIYKGLKKGFSYTPHEDRWGELLAKGEADYESSKHQIVKVRVTKMYHDLHLGRIVHLGEILEVEQQRADFLVNRDCVDYA
jgi:glycosyltransferase involved in cell wall biosynthesis